MREWLYVLLPVAIIFYFLIFPDQFSMFVNWATSFLYNPIV